MALPKSATNNDNDEKKGTRDPFPDEIETDEEKNHPLKQYKDIALKLQQIRESHLDGTLFDASQKSDDLAEYIKENYSESKILDEYESHPRRVLIKTHMKETNRMMNFMTTTEKWVLFKDDGTWKTEWQPSQDSDYESFRLTGISDVDLFNIVAVVYEMDLMKSWMPLCKESFECGQLSLYSKCGYMRLGLFWPIQDRECILFGYGVDDLKNGKILIYFDSREDHNTDAVKIPKCPKGRCRVDVFLGGFLFERLTDHKTKITCVWNCDPKVMVPTAIINWFAGTFAGTLISCIVKAAQFDKNSEYAKRIENNEEFYGKMKKRLAEGRTMSDLKSVDQKKTQINNNNDDDEKKEDNESNINNNENENDDNKEQPKQENASQ